jgi:flagellar biosynthesis/type III secretory pathway protein FliH
MKCWPEEGNDRMVADVELFEYPAVGAPPPISWEAFGTSAAEQCLEQFEYRGTAVQANARCAPETEAPGDESQRSFESGREQGICEGRAAERQSCDAQMRARESWRVEQTARLVESFSLQQTRYFQSMEREVVRLALQIAARILHREAQMDPLLLTGAVRAALGQLSGSTKARLRVPASELDLWKETIANLPNLAVKPAVLAGDGLGTGECQLETELGSVDLALASQLGEIERTLLEGSVQDGKETQAATIAEDMSE